MGYDDPLMPQGRLPDLREETDKSRMIPHQCPICGKWHWVNQARHSVAWGRQYTCGRECEVRRRIRWKASED